MVAAEGGRQAIVSAISFLMISFGFPDGPGSETHINVGFVRSAQVAAYADRQQATCT
jgi:hypothetical protein